MVAPVAAARGLPGVPGVVEAEPGHAHLVARLRERLPQGVAAHPLPGAAFEHPLGAGVAVEVLGEDGEYMRRERVDAVAGIGLVWGG